MFLILNGNHYDELNNLPNMEECLDYILANREKINVKSDEFKIIKTKKEMFLVMYEKLPFLEADDRPTTHFYNPATDEHKHIVGNYLYFNFPRWKDVIDLCG